MRAYEPNDRLETLTAALLYLMTQHARTGCPRLAAQVSRHMQWLALHPQAQPVVRDVCASLHGTWARASCDAANERAVH